MEDKYFVVKHTENSDWSEEYDMHVGPNGFKCCITEPEDRNFSRDLRMVITELNRLNREKEAAQKLCEIYFNIAAEQIGADVVRAKTTLLQ